MASTAVLVATLLFEVSVSLAGATDPAFLEFIPAIVVIAFLENRRIALASTLLMAAAGLGARIIVNGQILADEWVRAILLVLSGGMIAFLLDRSSRQSALLSAAVRKQEKLMLEQRHRFSNLFPVITAIVKMLDAPEGDLANFKETLVERIRALEATHTLLMHSADGSSTIHDLIVQELKPFLEAGKATITGPDIKISGGAAESFAMIVHELTTNSIKHGVLGDALGKVEARWALAPGGQSDEIVFDWIETGRRRATSIKRQGFGSMILGADGTPLLGHSSQFEIREDGLRYSLRLSRKEVQA